MATNANIEMARVVSPASMVLRIRKFSILPSRHEYVFASSISHPVKMVWGVSTFQASQEKRTVVAGASLLHPAK